MKKRTFLVFLVIPVFVVAFSSCDEFFSSTWGNARKYDQAKIEVSAGNVDQWIERASGDPALADTVTGKIIEELKKDNAAGTPTLTSEEKAALTDAGIQLAVESSGVGTSIVANAAPSLSDLMDTGKTNEEKTELVKEIFEKMQPEFANNNGSKAANDIATIVDLSLKKEPGQTEGGVAPGKAPEFSSSYAENVNPADISEVVVALVLGVLQENDLTVAEIQSREDLDWKDLGTLVEGLEFDSANNQVKTTLDGPRPSEKAVALSAYLNLIVDPAYEDKFENDQVIGAIRDNFFNR